MDVCLCDSLPLSLKYWEKQQNTVSEYYASGRQSQVSVSYLKAWVIFKLFDVSPNLIPLALQWAVDNHIWLSGCCGETPV